MAMKPTFKSIDQLKSAITDYIIYTLQTRSASPCPALALPVASFLVCFLIFIEYYCSNKQIKTKLKGLSPV
ncbi:hypothetical protein D3846_04655 [Streptococcus mutans]|nr:hypothetical protein EBA30_00125 [Streptococcus mutans]EMB59407.1 hypothetical protein SMU10_04895 [Streptococcus mutans 8ID3]EMB68628.1 hypothetical protein SMU36_09771 [Streptococcus mutans 4VF1]EMB69231.1 hypothetical protein SMU33_08328 [Streptococcus mutans 11SSST2]EMB74870.1 hypothetical protein SMU40_02880 [Streptococcus mutans 15VF2]EMB81577.1 hypothetical protein SMU52_05414 [Streptococcus mutans NFSM2]EMB92954.1 hypothetical protein SMU61_09060 [Streptococcus mutans G123]EMB9864